MRQIMYLSISLAIIWLSNSGHYTPLILVLGFLSIVFVVWIAHKMNILSKQPHSFSLVVILPAYWLWLMKEIVLSNIDVVRRIWRGVDSIDPTTVTLPIHQNSDLGQVIYANSITLTPGTVTLDLKDDQITVHALSAEGVEGLKRGTMSRRVSKLER